MHLDPLMPLFVALALAIAAMGLLLRTIRQPAVLGYLLIGVLAGPHGLGLITEVSAIERLGAIGVILLLFFVGLEVSPPRLLSRWRIAILGTGLQVVASVGSVWILGLILDWPFPRIILIGFGISLSSTAVVLKLLHQWKEMDSEIGNDATGILLVQDLAIVPMLIILGFLGNQSPSPSQITVQVLGGLVVLALSAWLIKSRRFQLPFHASIRDDAELQVFVALGLCFGLALITGLLQLSVALGAFIGGMVVASLRETHWVQRSLKSFEIVFLALFFLSVGMLVDLEFLWQEWKALTALLGLVILTNTGINAVILKALGSNWRQSLYIGALLSQIGELSFLLAAVGRNGQIISETGYQMLIVLISLSLFVSPVWTALLRRLTRQEPQGTPESTATAPSGAPHT